jgi:hypothetical protein
MAGNYTLNCHEDQATLIEICVAARRPPPQHRPPPTIISALRSTQPPACPMPPTHHAPTPTTLTPLALRATTHCVCIYCELVVKSESVKS